MSPSGATGPRSRAFAGTGERGALGRGTPAGVIVEHICLVATWRPPVREAAVLEVIAQHPGRSFAVRSLSAPHLLAQAVVLEAVPGGTEVTVVVSLQEHAPVLAREAARRWDAAEAYLARIRDAVGSSAAGDA